MKKTIYFVAVLFTFSMLSCENFFEVSVPIDINDHKTKLALSAQVSVFSDLDSISYNILVSKSLGALKESDRESYKISNADINFLVNNTNYEFKESEKKGYYIPKNPQDIVYTAGETYKLKTDKSGFNTVESSQVFPSKVPIKNVSFNSDLLKVTFQDTKGQDNYYILELISSYRNSYTGIINLQPFGGSTRSSSLKYNRVIFSDEFFDGELKEITVKTLPQRSDNEKYIVNLYHVNKDFYNYDISYGLAEDAIENPFAEPVILYSNVTNGYGIFALSNVSSFVID